MSTKDIEAIYPLSPSQQGILFETLAAPESGIHIEQSTVTLRGNLNFTALEHSWQRVVERHSLLRTGFVWKNQDEPLQFVLKEAKVPLQLHDWRELSSSQKQEQLKAFLSADRCLGFKLSKAPLMRLSLFQTDENTYQLVWTIHHILMDGWCLPILLKEFFKMYKAFSTEQHLSLPSIPPYEKYIAWLKQQDLSQAESFWRQKLHGFTQPTPLGIKAEPISSSAQKERYGEQKASLSAAATTALQSLVRQHHLSLNNLVQGIWALLLSRYSGKEDVVFGTTVSGRPPSLAGVESMLGLFINTLPMRIEISPDELLWDWLKNIQLQQVEQQAYEYCSAGQVHQWSDMPGALPLSEGILVFENYPDDSSTLQFSDLSIDIRDTFYKGAQTNYALTILIIPGSELEFHIVYDNYRFDSQDVARILEHLLILLQSIIAVPAQQLATLISKVPSEQIPKDRLLQKRHQHELQENFVAPRDALELKLAQIWEDVLDVRPLGVKDNFFDIGGHSLLAIRLMTKIQQQFEKDLPLAALFPDATIEKLASALRQQTDCLPWNPLVAIQLGGSKRPFFCIPGGGGNVIYLYHLARYLGSDQPFYGLEARGIDGEQAPHTKVEDIVADNIAAIQSVQPQGPYFLGGHSFGGFVAFEMALELQMQGHRVALLALIDTPVPIPCYQPVEDDDDARDLTYLVHIVERLYGENLSVSYENLQPLEPDEQLNYVLERLKKVNIFPVEAKLKQLRGLLQVFKSKGVDRYVPQSVYPNRITLFRASEESHSDPVMGWEKFAYDAPAMGWGQFSFKPVETHDVPGDHITIMTEPHVQILAEKLGACLERAQVDEGKK